MNPLTPLIDTPKGRIAELVHLLTDQPLHLAYEAVDVTDTQHPTQQADPWWVVAGAVVRLADPESLLAAAAQRASTEPVQQHQDIAILV